MFCNDRIDAHGGRYGAVQSRRCRSAERILRRLDPVVQIYYFMGSTASACQLVVLSSFTSMVAMGASWPIQKHVKATAFCSSCWKPACSASSWRSDFFLFYVFWEVMLCRCTSSSACGAARRRVYAAIKFFLYTLLGSVLMLIAILMLYFNSDVRKLTPAQMETARIVAPGDAKAVNAIKSEKDAVHTFNIMALQSLGQTTDQFDREILFG